MAALPAVETTRRTLGAVLYVLLVLAGGAILVDLFFLPPLATKQPLQQYEAMAIGALLAFPPLVLYLWIPWLVDRFDPEPWWCLALALLWGAVGACGFSALVNTAAADWGQAALGVHGKAAADAGETVAAVLSAPFVEEFFKGFAVFGAFYFLRREFDGVVDGIIYATFAALGFAATENMVYYARAGMAEVLQHKHGIVEATFLVRGVLSPWGHPLYSSMTGLGFGVARETSRTWVRWLSPLAGYLGAVLLHGIWNAAATLTKMTALLMLPLWLLFVAGFFALVIGLVVRKGRIIRSHLRDEVLSGYLTRDEVDLICSPFGRLKATFRHGGLAGRRFVAAGARLGLCKWHALRALHGRKRTVSVEFIGPLRQELARLRAEMRQSMGYAAAPAYPVQPVPGGFRAQPGPPPGQVRPGPYRPGG